MKIFIDADGCPVVDLTIKIAKNFNIPVVIIKNQAHNIRSDYAEILTVDVSPDSADFLIFTKISKGDILVSQDLGLISMVLAKSTVCINQDGNIYNNDNIDFHLHTRHINSKLRREKKIFTKIKKRDPLQDALFEKNLVKILKDRIN